MMRRTLHSAPALPAVLRRPVLLAALVRIAESAFAVLALSVFAGTVTTMAAYLGLIGGGDSPRQLFLPPIYIGSGFIVLLHPAGLISAVRRNPAAAVLTALAIVSCIWSAAPMLTLRRGLLLVGLTLFAVHLVTRFSRRDILRLLTRTVGIIVLLSLVFVVFVPGRGISHGLHEGAWTGIYSDKNFFGRIMALGTIVFAAGAITTEDHRRIAWLGAALCAGLTVMSDSATAMVALAAALAVIPLAPVLRARGLILTSAVLAGAVVIATAAAMLLSNLDAAAAALGKSGTLSGRLPLWQALAAAVAERPLLGHGYDAFWVNDGGAPSALEFTVTGDWAVWHAHNGFIQLALELGLAGVVLCLVACAAAIRRATMRMRNTGGPKEAWPLALLVFVLVTSISESVLLRYSGLWWVLFLVVAFGPAPDGGGHAAGPSVPRAAVRRIQLRRPRTRPVARKTHALH